MIEIWLNAIDCIIPLKMLFSIQDQGTFILTLNSRIEKKELGVNNLHNQVTAWNQFSQNPIWILMKDRV